MILYQFFITDTRVKREASTLANYGYNIEIINLKRPNQITRVKFHKKIKNNEIMELDPKKRQSVFNLIKFWISVFLHLIKVKEIPDVIHAHDLTGLPPAVLYKLIFPKVKLIYDSHELFPEAAKDKLNLLYGLIFLFIESVCGKFVNLLVGASPLQIKILKRRIKKPSFYLLNVPDLDSIPKEFKISFLLDHPLVPINERKVKVVYSGGVYPYRGYIEYVLSAAKVIEINPNFEFWIVGDGIYLNKVKEMVKKENLINYFIFTGEVSYLKLLELTYNCDIAIGLYENIDNNNIMISNKIFEYMLVGIPFLFTNLKSSRMYIDNVNAIGIDFPINPKIVAEKILSLAKNKKIQNEISFKSKALIGDKLNWKNESRKLIEIYSDVLGYKL